MELILWAALFYGALCVVPVPGHARLVHATRRGVRVVAGGGPRLLPPWPSSACWIAEEVPFTTASDGVACGHSLARYAEDLVPRARHAGFDALGEARARGALVQIAGAPFARTSHPTAARGFAALLRELGSKGTGEAETAQEGALARSLCERESREAFETCRAAIRGLGLACDGYLVLVFGVTPALVLLQGAERAIWLLIPALLVAHLVCGMLLWRAVRRLPSTRGHRFELLTTALLFPPSLLRAPQDLLRGELALLHPAAATALLAGDTEERSEWLRRDLARLDARRPEDPLALAIWRRQRALHLALAQAYGIAPDAFARTRSREDPVARSYCPICLADYRIAGIPCNDCGVETVAYEQAAPTGGDHPHPESASAARRA